MVQRGAGEGEVGGERPCQAGGCGVSVPEGCLPLPLTLLCLSWCSVSFLGLLAEHCACCFGFASLSVEIRVLGEAFRASSVSLSWWLRQLCASG